MSSIPPVSFQLPNQMQVILKSVPTSKSVTSILSIGVGSRHESEEVAGIAHFLEHIISKKTALWQEKETLEQWVEQAGMYRNAYTSSYNTAYWFEGQPNQLEKILDYSHAIVFTPQFEEELVEEEKGIITEEWKMYWDSPEGYADMLVDELKYRGHPLAHPVIGYEKSINSFNLKQVLKFYQTNYSPARMVLVIAGGFDVDNVRNLVVQKFANEAHVGLPAELDLYVNDQCEPRVRVEQRDVKQMVMRLDFKGEGIKSGNRPVADVLMAILSMGKASVFHHELLNQTGLVNGYDTSISWQPEVSGWQMEFTCAPGQGSKVTLAVAEILNRLKAGKFAADMTRARELGKSLFVMSLEPVVDQAAYLLSSWQMLGRVMTPEEYLDQIDQTTPEQVVELAQQIFTPSNASMVWVGPNAHPADELVTAISMLKD